MKVIVVHIDGRQEVITLIEPVTVKRGEVLNQLISATGMEYWFDQNGFYDGWGRDIYAAKLSPDDGMKFAEAINKEREYPSVSPKPESGEK